MTKLIHADCIEAMSEMDEASVDAIVTDPPYGLEFMGKEWDSFKGGAGVEKTATSAGGASAYSSARVRFGQGAGTGQAFGAWTFDWAVEALRVLKPGGHLLAFGGTRTYHRLAVAIEDAGFEIRDCLAWMYGSGFPKSKNVSLAIDKAEGHGNRGRAIPTASTFQATDIEQKNKLTSNRVGSYEPKTDAAKEWEGWGTALKPAHEPIVLARKPLEGTVAANVQKWGTGGLNIDGCRIGIAPGDEPKAGHRTATFGTQKTVSGGDGSGSWTAAEGRWPANLALDETAAAMLDEQSGESKSQGGRIGKKAQSDVANVPAGQYEKGDPGYGDTGGASRFFYCAKASKSERNAGLDGFTPKQQDESRKQGNPGGDNPRNRGVHKSPNHHPTVKPISLMRWLVRVVTPPNGTVLDPFLGSGTTGCAAAIEGFDFIGIEREAEYLEIAQARIDHWRKQPQQESLV